MTYHAELAQSESAPGKPHRDVEAELVEKGRDDDVGIGHVWPGMWSGNQHRTRQSKILVIFTVGSRPPHRMSTNLESNEARRHQHGEKDDSSTPSPFAFRRPKLSKLIKIERHPALLRGIRPLCRQRPRI